MKLACVKQELAKFRFVKIKNIKKEIVIAVLMVSTRLYNQKKN